MIIGIDEVGRGCWAGPLVAAAVALPSVIPPDITALGLHDSKKLSGRQRQVIDAGLRALKVPTGLGWVSANEIDQLGLTRAVGLAMRRAYEQLPLNVRQKSPRLIIDGSFNYLPDIANSRAVVRADGSEAAVSAASIVAKVARDEWMRTKAADEYPVYGFEKHVGYGTPQHSKALREYGVCNLHRRSFKPVAAVVHC